MGVKGWGVRCRIKRYRDVNSSGDAYLYLLYGLALIAPAGGFADAEWWPNRERTLNGPEGSRIDIYRVGIVDRLPKGEVGQRAAKLLMAAFRIWGRPRVEKAAEMFAESVTAAMAVGADATRNEAFIAVPLHADQVRGDGLVRREALAFDPREPEVFRGPMSSMGIPSEAMDMVWRLAGALSNKASLREAALLYRESILQAWVADDDVPVHSSQECIAPISGSDRIRVATAYHAAFKAVEAVLGGKLPDDESRLKRRLRKAGLDPEEVVEVCVPYRGLDEETLARKVDSMRVTRDEISAHGGLRSSRAISDLELKDKQALARLIILRLALG